MHRKNGLFRPRQLLGHPTHQQDFFTRFATRMARIVGTSAAFSVAVALIILWALTGPLFHFSDTWQLVINTSTTIITFLMVFLIQNTQNRDSEALHLKIDALIVGSPHARNALVEMEDMTQQELDALKKRFMEIAHRDGSVLSPDTLEEQLENAEPDESLR